MNPERRSALALAVSAMLTAGCTSTASTPPTTEYTVAPSQNPPPTLSPARATTHGPSPSSKVFTSPLYGYSVDPPVGWQVMPATLPWPAGAAYEGKNPEWFDVFIQPAAIYPNVGWNGVGAQTIPEVSTAEEWMLAYAERQAASSYVCKGEPQDWIDAMVGTLVIRRIDIICDGLLLSGEDATGWHAAEVVFVVGNDGYVMRGNPEGLDPLLRSFRPGAP